MVVLPFGHHSTTLLCFSGGSGFLHKHPVCRAPPSLLSPQDVSSRPTAVLCLGLLSKPHISGPSPRVQWWTPRSGLGSRAVVSTVCSGLTLSCLPLTGAASSSHKRMRLPAWLGNPMDRRALWATVYGVARVGHDLETKPPPAVM